ncbi:MAG: phosphonate C-P lyase system protein PhnH [Alphaproteobacteria bacterium]|nr:phosphonate C-P lyase system protein PhnH [Alphaproteobacteria bacterium]
MAMPGIADAKLAPGFADPGRDSQRVFRAALAAMAEPGRIATLDLRLQPTPPLGLAQSALALTLLDFEVALWLDGPVAPAADYLRFHTGVRLAARPEDADYCLIAGPLPPLSSFKAGSEEEPEAGATLIVAVAGLLGDGPWRLKGPGLPHEGRLGVGGLPADFAAQWAQNQRAFPRGIDLFLCAGSRLVGLPRTLTIEG